VAAVSEPSAAARSDLRARLEASHAALVRALEGLTERDFAAPLEPGSDETVVQALAALALAERREVAQLRGTAIDAAVPQKPTPPQVVHDLAGARHQVHRLVDDFGADAEGLPALVERLATLEETTAERIAARPRE
jgi:hypothetical protein